MAGALHAEADYVTPNEYLASEAAGNVRHEYLAGAVYALSGTTVAHGWIIQNMMRELGLQLRGHRCEAFTSEIKVRIPVGADSLFYYPDVVVDCSRPPDESLFAEEPRVIFEVLSPSTERTDRYEKRLNYQKLATLDVYMLVDQGRVAVTTYRRADGDNWTTEFLSDLPAVLELPAIGCALPLATIYERTLLGR